jgi:hypothetical protein
MEFLRIFQFQVWARQDCLIFIGGVVDTGEQLFGGVVDTGDKF